MIISHYAISRQFTISLILVTAFTYMGNRGYAVCNIVTKHLRNDPTYIHEALFDEQIIYTLTYTAGENGSLEGETEQLVEHGGDGTPVEAVPDHGYQFVGWSDDLPDNPRTDTEVSSDISVTAYFEIIVYTLTYTAGENGSLEGETDQLVEHGGDGTPVEAVPDYGYQFVGWSDDLPDNPLTDTEVTSDIFLKAFFGPIIYGKDTLCLEEWHVYYLQESVYKSYEHINWKIETMGNDAQIYGPDNNKKVLVAAGDIPGSFELSVCVWSGDESAANCNKLFIYAHGQPPDNAWIQKKGSNLLLVNHTEPPFFDSFQWGKTHKSSFETIKLENAIRPYHYFDEPISTHAHYYWVDTKVESNLCVRRSFYNHPDGSVLGNLEVEATNPFNVYPLPTVDFLYVESMSNAHTISEVYVFSMDGNIVFRKSFQPITIDNKIILDLKYLPSGIYILSLNTAQQQHIKKIIKQ